MHVQLRMLLRRYWLASVVLFFALSVGHTRLSVANAAPVATPDIETVPPLEAVVTPTNTPFPTPTLAAVNTPFPTPTRAAVNTPVPTATKRAPATNDDENSSAPGGSAQTPSQPTGGQPASNPPVITTSTTTTTTLSGVVAVTLLELRRTPAADGKIADTAFNNDPVTVLGRTSDGKWWLICCGANKQQGWAQAQMLRPNFALAAANTLIPVVAGASAGTTAGTAQAGSSAAGKKGAILQVEMRSKPAFVWQGQQFELQLIITNQGDTAATNVRLRNDLPMLLHYRTAFITQQGMIRPQRAAQGNTIFNIEWTSLAPGAQATATITLQVAPDAPAGALIDNLALVSAQNAANAVVGITFAMPPTLAPQFR